MCHVGEGEGEGSGIWGGGSFSKRMKDVLAVLHSQPCQNHEKMHARVT